GDFITVLDSDDLLLPEALASLDRRLRRTDAAWIYGDYVESRGGQTAVICLPTFASADALRSAIFLRPRLPFKHSGTTIERKLLLDLGGYDESLDIKVDIELYLRAIERGVWLEHVAE